MSDAEAVAFRLLATTDAYVWAEEFMNLIERGMEIDFSLMHGWFANAIETGRTAGREVQQSDGSNDGPDA